MWRGEVALTFRTSSRIAGYAFLLYIALGIAAMALFGRATGDGETAAKLAGIAQHETLARLAALCNLLTAFTALALGVSLYALTRAVDRDLALLGLACRVGEGVIGAAGMQSSLGLLWLSTTTGAEAPSAEGAQAIGAYLLAQNSGVLVAGLFFAVGSSFFAWLFLKGRLIPAWLAWLGLVASLLLVVGLPLRLAGALPGSVAMALWAPMAAFEIPFAVWLLIRGIAPR
ncbi:DUF4386 domain-containing protein [bacterium]|nr:DUF4386 domain-containing protein [bacterium]